MKLISGVLVFLFVCPALSAPPLHSYETQNNDQTHLGTQAHQVTAVKGDGLNSDYHPRVISATGSVDGGNRNKTLGQKIVEFFHQNEWIYAVIVVCALIVIIVCLVIFLCCCYHYRKHQGCCTPRRGYRQVNLEDSTDMSTESHQVIAERFRRKRPLEDNPEDNALKFFLDNNGQYEFNDEKLDDLGSRVQKNWYAARLIQGEERKQVILTVAPLSASCPLQMHKHQKGLNKLLGAIKVHPFLHPIFEVAYLASHEKVVIVQPKMPNGSLKDLIYEVSYPIILDWSQKYSNKSSGLSSDKVARYGRQILEAVEFLYHKGFPTALGHIQSGNIFVVQDVCKLGGYENTLLGYKTRLYRLCKDHMDHFDTILFGHLIFEMSAGYELKQLAPGKDDYKTVHKSVKPVLEHIFDDELSHSISDIKDHSFFDVLLPELKDFKPAEVQLTDSMRVVLEKVRKNKPRVQISDQPLFSGPSSWKDRFRVPKQLKQFFTPKKKESGEDVGIPIKKGVEDDDDEPLLDLST